MLVTTTFHKKCSLDTVTRFTILKFASEILFCLFLVTDNEEMVERDAGKFLQLELQNVLCAYALITAYYKFANRAWFIFYGTIIMLRGNIGSTLKK